MDSEASIRPRQPPDLPQLAVILTKVYQTDGYPVEGVSDPLGWLSPSGLLRAWIATTSDAAIVGHVLAISPKPKDSAVTAFLSHNDGYDSADDVAVLARLFVDSSARGQGLGTKLVEAAMRWAAEEQKRLVLDVLEKDEAATRVYERLGWVRFGEGVHENGLGERFVEGLYVSPRREGLVRKK